MAYLNYRGSRLDLNGKLTTIGSGQCDIQIQGSGVELQHSIIEFDPQTNEYWLKDLNTKFGTSVNGMTLRDASTPIAPGDKIKFGSTEDSLMFCLTENPLPVRKLPSSIRIVSALGPRNRENNFANSKSIWLNRSGDKAKPPSPALNRYRHRIISGGSAIDKSFVQYEGVSVGSFVPQQTDVMSVSSADSFDVRNRYGESTQHRKNVRFPQSHVISHLQTKIQRLEETVRQYDSRLKSYPTEEMLVVSKPNLRRNSTAELYEKAELLEQIGQLQNRLTEKTIEVEQMGGKLGSLQAELQEKSQTIIEMVHRSNTKGVSNGFGKPHLRRSSNSLGSVSSVVSIAHSHSPNLFSSTEQLFEKSMSLPHLFEEPIRVNHKHNVQYSMDDLLESNEHFKNLKMENAKLEADSQKLKEDLKTSAFNHKLTTVIEEVILHDANDTFDKITSGKTDWNTVLTGVGDKMKSYKETVKSTVAHDAKDTETVDKILTELLKPWESLITKVSHVGPILIDFKHKADQLGSLQTSTNAEVHWLSQWVLDISNAIKTNGLSSATLKNYQEMLKSRQMKETFSELTTNLLTLTSVIAVDLHAIEQKLSTSVPNATLHDGLNQLLATYGDQLALLEQCQSHNVQLMKEVEESKKQSEKLSEDVDLVRKEREVLLERAERAELDLSRLTESHQSQSETELKSLEEERKQLESERDELLVNLKSIESQRETDRLEIDRFNQLRLELETKISQLEDKGDASEPPIVTPTKDISIGTETEMDSKCDCSLHNSLSTKDFSVVKLEEDKNHLEQEVFNLQEKILELEHLLEGQKKIVVDEDTKIIQLQELQQKLNEQERKFESVHKELTNTKEELNTYRFTNERGDPPESINPTNSSEFLELPHRLATLLELEKVPTDEQKPSETVLTADRIAESVEELLRRVQSQNEELKTYRSARLESSQDESNFRLKEFTNGHNSSSTSSSLVSVQMATRKSTKSSPKITKSSPKPKKKDFPLKVVTFDLPK